MSERVEKLVEFLLESVPADPQAVAAEIGVSFQGEEEWHGVGKLWAFTDTNPHTQTSGISFYVRVGATRDEIVQRWEQKKAEFLVR